MSKPFSNDAVYALAEHLHRVKELHARSAMTPWEGLADFQIEHELEAAAYALRSVAPHVAFCPTCTGNIRETSGMVCQTCGRDYA